LSAIAVSNAPSHGHEPGLQAPANILPKVSCAVNLIDRLTHHVEIIAIKL
jgi:hypothetical protein